MNPLTKIVTIGTLWGCVALGVATPTDIAGSPAATANSLCASFVAEVRDHVTKAFALERLVRAGTTRVAVIEGNHMIVEASRLPRELSSEAWRYVVRVASNI